MPNSSHTMPNPRVVPILWGHDYVANPATAKPVEQWRPTWLPGRS